MTVNSSRLFATLTLALVLTTAAAAEASNGGAQTRSVASPVATGQAIVEGRLLAPCCYTQTLDVHESPMATDLRLEVRTRLAAGESPEAIEDDFASRYGERVRAVPKGRDPRGSMFLVAIGVLVAAGIGLALVVRRWRRTPVDAPSVVVSESHASLDERIDAELRELEG
jgi:cytochrome c-type biogenesis protein CcmH